MPIPPLQENGLLPVGVHHCSLDEVAAAFCWNERRQAIWGGCLQFLHWLNGEGLSAPIYLDGSFVTDKAQPSDVDLVHDLVGTGDGMQMRGLYLFYRERAAIKAQYLVDYCPNLDGQSNFGEFFQYVGTKTAHAKGIAPKDKKGILRVAQWAVGLNK